MSFDDDKIAEPPAATVIHPMPPSYGELAEVEPSAEPVIEYRQNVAASPAHADFTTFDIVVEPHTPVLIPVEEPYDVDVRVVTPDGFRIVEAPGGEGSDDEVDDEEPDEAILPPALRDALRAQRTQQQHVPKPVSASEQRLRSLRAQRKIRTYETAFMRQHGRRPQGPEEWGEAWPAFRREQLIREQTALAHAAGQSDRRRSRQLTLPRRNLAQATLAAAVAGPSREQDQNGERVQGSVSAHQEGSHQEHIRVRAQVRTYEMDYEKQHGCRPRTQDEWGEAWPAYHRLLLLRQQEMSRMYVRVATSASSDDVMAMQSAPGDETPVRPPSPVRSVENLARARARKASQEGEGGMRV